MKIAQIVCVYPPYGGGIGNSAFSFARLLKRQNFTIATFTPNYYGDKDEEDGEGGKIIRLKPFLKYGNGAWLPQLLWELKDFDIIWLHYPFFGSAEMVWLYKLLNKEKKLIIHYHMDVFHYKNFGKFLSIPSNLIKKSLFKKADLISCASLDYVQHGQLGSFYKRYQEKFIEINFGVDTEKFQPQINKENNTVNLLFVGGLDKAHYFKGVDVLLTAVSKLKNKNWILKIVGCGDLLPSYKKTAAKLKISEKVLFLDNISNNELPAVYRTSDIFILPSTNSGEAFGLVLLEAMASGLPVIASKLPGVRTVFEDEQEGLLIRPGDEEDLKEKIELLITNEDLRKKMGSSARQLAEKKYSWKKIAENLADAIKKL